MKRSLFTLFLALLFCSTGALAQPKSELGQAMSQIESSFKFLRQNIKSDALNQDNALEIILLIEAAEKAAQLEPPGTERMPEQQREKYVKGYQSALNAMVADATTLHAMVRQNKPADERYEQLMKLLQHQKRGHRSYQRPER